MLIGVVAAITVGLAAWVAKKKMGKGVSGSIRYTLRASRGSDLTISPLSTLLRSFPLLAGQERDGQLYHGDK